MADQRIVLTNLIVTWLKKINASIQKLGDYVTANTYNLNADAIVEIIGVSGIEASTKIATKLRGILAVVEAGGAEGSLSILTDLISSAGDISGADGILTGIWTNRGIVEEFSGVDGNLTGIWTNRGLIEEDSGADAKLDVSTQLAGNVSGISFANTSTLQSPPSDL